MASVETNAENRWSSIPIYGGDQAGYNGGMSVYTITVTLTPEEDAALRARASHAGSTAEELLRQAARAPVADGPGERNARLIALLEGFEAGDEAQTQARDFAQLQENLASGRPGQRNPFGEGVYP